MPKVHGYFDQWWPPKRRNLHCFLPKIFPIGGLTLSHVSFCSQVQVGLLSKSHCKLPVWWNRLRSCKWHREERKVRHCDQIRHCCANSCKQWCHFPNGQRGTSNSLQSSRSCHSFFSYDKVVAKNGSVQIVSEFFHVSATEALLHMRFFIFPL